MPIKYTVSVGSLCPTGEAPVGSLCVGHLCAHQHLACVESTCKGLPHRGSPCPCSTRCGDSFCSDTQAAETEAGRGAKLLEGAGLPLHHPHFIPQSLGSCPVPGRITWDTSAAPCQKSRCQSHCQAAPEGVTAGWWQSSQDRDTAWRKERPLTAWGPQSAPGTQDHELMGVLGDGQGCGWVGGIGEMWVGGCAVLCPPHCPCVSDVGVRTRTCGGL